LPSRESGKRGGVIPETLLLRITRFGRERGGEKRERGKVFPDSKPALSRTREEEKKEGGLSFLQKSP